MTPEEWRTIAEELRLSPRQAEVVGLVLRGMRDKQIAAELGLSLPTVRMHLRHVFGRLGVADRMELALRVFAMIRAGDGRPGHHQK
jgi:DNA-binding NarL/FixJ family response regulator